MRWERILIDKKIQNVQSIRECLLWEMKEGMFAECERLPRETMLAEKLGLTQCSRGGCPGGPKSMDAVVAVV